MSKRNPGLPRNPRDDYPTPFEPANKIADWLFHDGSCFAEPCAGDGKLVRHLEMCGLSCAYKGDIATGRDAMQWWNTMGIPMIVTNPPWNRKILHPLITHFLTLEPVAIWLLIDADWAHTRQANSYLRYCTHIVSIGRVRWMEGTKMDGFDNSAWYRFHKEATDWPKFIYRK